MTDARDVIAQTIDAQRAVESVAGYDPPRDAQDILAALAAVGLTITETPHWEWGVRWGSGVSVCRDEADARRIADPSGVAVRRPRRVIAWEVAP